MYLVYNKYSLQLKPVQRCAVLLKREVIRQWLLDAWQQVPYQECVTIVPFINLDARVHKVKIRMAQCQHTDWCHDRMTEGRPCAQQALRYHIFCVNSSDHVHPVVLHAAWGCDGKYFFIHEPYEVHSGRWISLQQVAATFKSCLLVGSGELVWRLLWHCSFSFFLMTALTDATEIPNWHAICLCVLWICGAVSWVQSRYQCKRCADDHCQCVTWNFLFSQLL